MSQKPKARRKQEDRTAETRAALIEAAIAVIHKSGYGAASSALIAEHAGVSRGSIIHHFGTRTALLAQVVQFVFDREMIEYEEIMQSGSFGHSFADWPKILWQVLGRPSGLAVLEILQAARSDPGLSSAIGALQGTIEQAALGAAMREFGGSQADTLGAMRLITWAIRGLTLAQVLTSGKDELERSVDLLSRLLRHAAPSGKIDDLLSVLGED